MCNTYKCGRQCRRTHDHVRAPTTHPLTRNYSTPTTILWRTSLALLLGAMHCIYIHSCYLLACARLDPIFSQPLHAVHPIDKIMIGRGALLSRPYPQGDLPTELVCANKCNDILWKQHLKDIRGQHQLGVVKLNIGKRFIRFKTIRILKVLVNYLIMEQLNDRPPNEKAFHSIIWKYTS